MNHDSAEQGGIDPVLENRLELESLGQLLPDLRERIARKSGRAHHLNPLPPLLQLVFELHLFENQREQIQPIVPGEHSQEVDEQL